MLYFSLIYVVLAIGAFVCFAVIYISKNETEKYYNAADKIIREDILAHAVRNPYINKQPAPASRRLMLGVKIKNGKKKNIQVFDPCKPVYIGSAETNQIRVMNNAVSSTHACIFNSENKLWINDRCPSVSIKIKRGSRKVICRPGSSVRLRAGDIIIFNNYKLTFRIFVYDIYHK